MIQIPWYIILLLILISIVSCTIGGIAGFAGGVLMLPIFAITLTSYGYDLLVVIGSNAAGTIFTGLISTLLTIKRREINWLLGIVFVIPIFAGTFLGAYITTLINENAIATTFSVIIIFLAILMILKWYNQKLSQNTTSKTNDVQIKDMKDKSPNFFDKLNSKWPTMKVRYEEQIHSINLIFLTILGFIIGTISGIVGLGCGWAVPPLLILLYNLNPQMAISTALFMTTLSLAVNGAIHISYNHFNIWIWLIVASGSIVGGLLGVFLKRRFKTRNLIIFISIIMVVISVVMLIKTWSNLY